nr:hypothetical protein [Tanacetum cinerariifolium]
MQKQPEAFQQSQPQPRFKEPQPPTKDNRIRKRMVKQATVDLAKDDEKEEEQTRQCASKEEKVYARTCVVYFKSSLQMDALKPLETDDNTEIFGPDARLRPAGKTRPAKKTKFETTRSSGESASRSISDYEELKRKLQAGTSAYEAKKEKRIGDYGVKEKEFLTIDSDTLS